MGAIQTVLGASLLNTPARIGWYAARVPGLGFLLKSPDVMLEYGHFYDVEGVGRFRSRFSAEELERIDARRGAKVGALLADASDDNYKSFLAEHTPITDPFAHEARVHLFRRDRYLLTAEWHPEDVDWYRRDITVGHRENRILELLYPNTLRHSGRAFSPERLAYLEEMQFPEREYESRVSEGLVTRIGERHGVVGGALLLGLLAVTHRAAARTAERGATR